MTVLGLVLAAGAGARFGPTAKLAAPFGATTVIGAAVSAAARAGLDEVAVVVGPGGETPGLDPDALTGLVPGDVGAAVTVLVNPRPADGLASSLAVGLDHGRRQGHHAVVVGLGDQPLLDRRGWRAVGEAVAGGLGPIVFATYGGRRGHPVGVVVHGVHLQVGVQHVLRVLPGVGGVERAGPCDRRASCCHPATDRDRGKTGGYDSGHPNSGRY